MEAGSWQKITYTTYPKKQKFFQGTHKVAFVSYTEATKAMHNSM